MALREVSNLYDKTVSDSISDSLRKTKNLVTSVIDNFSISKEHFWNSGFVGMSEAGKDELKIQIGNYIKAVQGELDKLNANAKLDTVIKGSAIEGAMHTYLETIKQLLEAYVATMKQELEEIDEAYKNFVTTAQGTISKDIKNMSSDISKLSTKIIEDGKKIQI